MKFTTLGLDPSCNSSRTRPAPEPRERTIPRAISRPLGRGRDYRCDAPYAPVPRPMTRRVPPPEPEEIEPEMPTLASAVNRRVPPPEPEEIKPEMQLAAATRSVAPPPEPQEIKTEMAALAGATTRRVLPPEPEEFKAAMPRGLLGSLFSFLRGGAPARKQLRLVETVPLGEKRFVAIIHAQGRKYLVGGGSSGVALLTSLDEPVSHSDPIAPVAEPVGVAG